MIRDIITIDEEKCNGCGACVTGCHEGALAMVGGKARLISESYCDGLGACLPECPTGAITIEKRDAAEFSLPEGHPAAAPSAAKVPPLSERVQPEALACGCSGIQSRTLRGTSAAAAPRKLSASLKTAAMKPVIEETESELAQWPCQLKLAPVNAPYFNNARLLIATDCAAYSRATFHQDFMRGRVTLIGCPKLDAGSYVEKLTEIFRTNPIRSILVTRMEVPCCGGLESAVKQALLASGKMIPWQVVTLGTDGQILAD